MTAPSWSWSWELDGRKLQVSGLVGADTGLELHAVEDASAGLVVDLHFDRDSAHSLAQFLADWAGLL